MKVAIIDADFLSMKNHRFPNLTAMKISGYWKERGAEVQLKHSYRLEWECDGSTSGWNVWYTMDKPDKTYVCKVFTDTPTPPEILEDKTVFYGGTGFFFDKAKPLPVEIEHHMPDYGLYTDSDMVRNWGEYYTKYSIGFLTRGCFRHCPFCVNQNSNRSVAWSPLEEFMDPDRPYLCFLDDNFFACRDWKKILQKVIDTGKPYQFKQGLDERLLDDEKCEMIFNSRYRGEYIFAFDNVKDAPIIEEKMKLIRKYTGKRCKFYVLCGMDTDVEQDIRAVFHRMEILGAYHMIPYVMRFMSPAGKPWERGPYKSLYNNLARWANMPRFWKITTFRQFCEFDQQKKKSPGDCKAMEALKRFEREYPETAKYFDKIFW